MICKSCSYQSLVNAVLTYIVDAYVDEGGEWPGDLTEAHLEVAVGDAIDLLEFTDCAKHAAQYEVDLREREKEGK